MRARFERRFGGASNAGLRARIRAVVQDAETADEAAARVRALGRTVALTAQGQATLDAVAADYAAVRS